MVIGPTPPGTGVMAEATADADSNSTSPHSLPASSRFIPTSITIAPGLIHEPGIIFVRPTAATKISAPRQTAAKSRVFEWARVTVALAAKSRPAIGLPTRLLRPTTTACAPSS